MTLRLAVIGCGLKAADYARSWMTSPEAPEVLALTDPSAEAVERYAGIVRSAGGAPPRVHPDARALLAAEAGQVDAVYVSTPHAFHAGIAQAALDTGLDVLLEKPMALSAEEARSILDACRRSGRTVVVAYQASLSPLLARLRERAAAGEFGALLSVSGEVWENWEDRYRGGWKQVPALSGGGFLFDTGSHLMNAVVVLSGRGYEAVAARLQPEDSDLDLTGSLLGALEGGVPVALTFCGRTIPGCESALTLFFERAILRADIWGKWAELRPADMDPIRETAGEDKGAVLSTFQAVRRGEIVNPSSPERSLHLAELWDLVKQSSRGGAVPLPLTTRP
ncbi:Gfo/Idh/MocA family oxidoreductase [Rubellimicrobium rubrum]|uniref:Gfo/Idh/MocA family oxidoreductase n=1 Tax=Rubellimicrobium rubrum TaxID=2585369 RepID=A0A5C4N0N1_9RHOB|nr:Gfo/Idh/MocA family oxidoreductase [Rubellimicrobium rubrum]TNC51662.1 Gfo/Idh/MocA family oxidoreductase [Rubellimicrobium rubrum]